MKQIFTTVMPDEVGAFLKADRCISQLGLNITRVSYNKAVDVHMLFLEVEGSPERLECAAKELSKLGYLPNTLGRGSVALIAFQLEDRPGTLLPVLELIHQFQLNISYINLQQSKGQKTNFKMGIFVENGWDISPFIQSISLLCPVQILDYDKSEKVLDNTVFYVSFAEDIARKMAFSEAEKQQLMVYSNQIMQILDDQNQPPYKTFDYIGRFADRLATFRGENFLPRVSSHKTHLGARIVLIEPPCGSNICVLECADGLLVADSGFALYRQEMLQVFETLYPNFQNRKKELFLTHSDVDHCGLTDLFDHVYVSRRCWEDFMHEAKQEPAFREENQLHAPYVKISKLLSGYRPPCVDTLSVIGGVLPGKTVLLERVGTLERQPFCFEVYEGQGGHLPGETVYVDRKQRVVFSGDIFVNLKGYTREQADFNRLAPYLMTSVDTDPILAKQERQALFELLGSGEWQIYGGHGAVAHTTLP